MAYTDDFTGTSGDLVENRTGWDLLQGTEGLKINNAGTGARANVATFHANYYTSGTFADDQYSESLISVAFDDLTSVGVCVRCRIQTNTYYYGYRWWNGQATYGRETFKIVNSSYTSLNQTLSGRPADGQVHRLEADGTTITPFRDGELDTQVGAKTDGSITYGIGGIMASGSGGISSLEDWEGGDLALLLEPGGIVSVEAHGTGAFKSLALPNGDVSVGNWKDQVGGGTNLYLVIDEIVPSASDYVELETAGTASQMEVTLSAVGTPTPDTGHLVCYTYIKDGAETVDLTVTLLEGTTTIASWTHNDIPESYVEAVQELTEVQAGNITSYANLRLRFSAVKP